MVSEDGLVKILDFGLAKLSLPSAELSSEAPTAVLESPRTQSGMILGTFGYMSPEQAAGRELDYRSDQFSFGSILYEMATGRRAFREDSPAQTLAAIIEEEPEPVPSLKPDVPQPFAWVIERCLAKSPAERYESTRDLARELANLRERISGWSVPGPAPARPRRFLMTTTPLAWVAAGLMLVALVASLRREPREPKTAGSGAIRFSVPSPEGASFHSGEILTKTAISPDGRTLALVAFAGGRSRLYVRPLDSVTPRALTGTEDAQSPFWSPDGRFVAFIAAGKLKKIDAGGPPQTLSEVSFDGPGTWGARFFPDGRRRLLLAPVEKAGARLYVADLDGKNLRPISPEGLRGNRCEISPDGELAAAVGPDRVPLLYPTSGGEPRSIPGAEVKDIPLRFSADGRGLFVARLRETFAEVHRVDLASGRWDPWKELKASDPAGLSPSGAIQITPDGQHYAYTYRRLLGDLILVDGLR